MKSAIDNYYDLAPGTTNSIKQKPDEVFADKMNEVDNGGMHYPTGTKVYKVFNDIECAGEVTGYDQKPKFYHIKCEDGNLEDFFHYEVCDHQKHNLPLI